MIMAGIARITDLTGRRSRVYPTPSYWVTDWMVAGYLQDQYEAQISVDQAREEARIAREDAEKAQQTAQAAQDQAEIAEAKAAQAQAELRAHNAELKLTQAEHAQEIAGKPNPNATPIDKDTKETLKNQIEQTVAEKKTLTEQANKRWNSGVAGCLENIGGSEAHLSGVESRQRYFRREFESGGKSERGRLVEGRAWPGRKIEERGRKRLDHDARNDFEGRRRRSRRRHAGQCVRA